MLSENNAKRQLDLKETNIPVKLIYDDNHRNGRNINTDATINAGQTGTKAPGDESEVKAESISNSKNVSSETSKQKTEKIREETVKKENENTAGPQARLLSIEDRENDENAKYGLLIQSRNKANTYSSYNDDSTAYSYGLRALPFNTFILSKGPKNHNNYADSLNQINYENTDVRGDDILSEEEDEGIVVSNDDEEQRGGNIKRRIQHYQYVIQPSKLLFDNSLYSSGGHSFLQQQPPFNWAPNPYRQNVFMPQTQTQIPVPFAPFSTYPASNRVMSNGNLLRAKKPSTKLFDDYFPIIVNNPFNEIWLGLTNIVEYGPDTDVCRANTGKQARRVSDKETVIELSTPRGHDTVPQISKLKVRRGGVAIAGPGGIATAGSGGTAIVGPGGTAYTTPSGTAVVGPGGKVVHVPEFPLFRGDASEPRIFEIPSNGKLVATGPVVYYDPPSS